MLIKNVLTSVSESFNYKDKTKVIFLNTGDILEGKFLHSNLSNVKTLPGQAKKSIKHNDILYSEIRPINKHFALVNFEETNNYVVSTKLMVLRNISESYNTKFIYQYLTSDKVIYDLQTMAESRSGTFPQITYEQLSTINLPDISLDEQQHIVNILGSIDNKIENLELITKKLQLEIKFNFIKEYNNLMSEKVIALEELVSETIPGDWGKDSLEGNYTTEVTCVRGADLPDLKNCNIDNAPTRFIINKNYISKKLQEYDFIVEMSGGSPTQSTGRTAFIPKDFENISNNLICTNFCKAIRCKNKENAIYCYLLFDMWYDSGLFFNYEIGTTGLKNFNLDAVLGLDIKHPTDEFLYNISNKFDLFYNKVIKNSQKIKKLNALKQLYLKKFFG